MQMKMLVCCTECALSSMEKSYSVQNVKHIVNFPVLCNLSELHTYPELLLCTILWSQCFSSSVLVSCISYTENSKGSRRSPIRESNLLKWIIALIWIDVSLDHASGR